jgi:hypothetical protein
MKIKVSNLLFRNPLFDALNKLFSTTVKCGAKAWEYMDFRDDFRKLEKHAHEVKDEIFKQFEVTTAADGSIVIQDTSKLPLFNAAFNAVLEREEEVADFHLKISEIDVEKFTCEELSALRACGLLVKDEPKP